MINIPVIFTPDYNLLESNEFFDSNEVLYSLIFDDVTCFDRLTPDIIHRHKIIQYKKYNFSIYFNFTDDPKALASRIVDSKEQLLHYFFYPQYKIIQNKPLICLNSKDAEKPFVQKTIAEIEKYAVSQGYDGMEVICFSDEMIESKRNINFSATTCLDAIFSEYTRLLTKKYYCSKYIGIDYKDAQRTIHKLVEIENDLFKRDPDHYHQLKEHQELKQQLLQLSEKVNRTEKELSNQKEYLKIFKDLDESTKIIEFYKYEYEMLPLWYKKIGHIIKVLMGKRTFRSLFDNDVKKYKD